MPQVSIILPVYNVEKYLRQCLDSIVNQTFKDFECICVNDGSTDNSVSILEEYAQKDKRFKIISQENRGLSGARNTGLKQATGKYVTFIDSDDWIADNFLEVLYEIIEKYQYDIAICNYQFYYSKDDKYIPFTQNIIIDKETAKFDKFRCCYICGSVNIKLYRKKFLEDNKITFLENVVMEDYIFSIISCLSTEKIISIKDCLYYYRKQVVSIMSNSDNVTISKFYNNFNLIRELRRRKINCPEIENFLVRTFFHNLSDICKRAKKSGANIENLYNKSLNALYFFNTIKKDLCLKYQIIIPASIKLFLLLKTKIFIFRNLFKIIH